MTTDFIKIHGAGNDFVFFLKAPPPNLNAASMEKLCATHFGIGADGLVFLWAQNDQWHWRYFNRDGSETDVCGNAARCAAYLILQQTQGPNAAVSWNGTLGMFRGRHSDACVEVSWPLAGQTSHAVPDELMQSLVGFNDHGLASAKIWDVGVPHLVLINHEDWSLETRASNGATLRSHPTLGLQGANVTWVSLRSKTAVTFERGVESETFACGSGALAAYLSLKSESLLDAHENHFVELKFPGGVLSVREDSDHSLWLGGPVTEVYRGSLLLPLWT